jgi:hypothetical protein
MSFDKPKVIIDLDEYQHLKNRIHGMDTDAYVVSAKKIIAALLTCKFDLPKVNDYLNKEGIIFNITSSFTKSVDGVHYDDISIALIDKSK